MSFEVQIIVGITALIAIGALIAAAALSFDLNLWYRCPLCRRFHNRSESRRELPIDSDGTVFLRICRDCNDAIAAKKRKETKEV